MQQIKRAAWGGIRGNNVPPSSSSHCDVLESDAAQPNLQGSSMPHTPYRAALGGTGAPWKCLRFQKLPRAWLSTEMEKRIVNRFTTTRLCSYLDHAFRPTGEYPQAIACRGCIHVAHARPTSKPCLHSLGLGHIFA